MKTFRLFRKGGVRGAEYAERSAESKQNIRKNSIETIKSELKESLNIEIY